MRGVEWTGAARVVETKAAAEAEAMGAPVDMCCTSIGTLRKHKLVHRALYIAGRPRRR